MSSQVKSVKLAAILRASIATFTASFLIGTITEIDLRFRVPEIFS